MNVSRRHWLAGCATALAGSSALNWRSLHAAEGCSGRIKIGQIGVGHAHASKLSVYRASSDYEVVGLVEPDESLRRRAESSAVYRDLPWMTTEQLLNVPGLQAVMVETRVRDLLSTAESCIAAGKHIHLDKPAGESFAQFRRLLADAERQRLLVQMGYMFRYNPAIVFLRDILQQGWLGELFEVHTVISKVVPPSNRRALAEYPGGIMFELGCHVIDLVVGLLGKPDRVAAWTRHSAPLDDGLLDNMLAVLEYPRCLASVRSTANEVDGAQRRHLVVCGSQGSFHIQPLDNPAGTLTLDRPRGDFKAGTQPVSFPKYSRYVDDAADMARVVRGEKAFEFPYAHDLAVQATVLQACGLKLDAPWPAG